MKTLTDIQNEVITKYRITIEPNSKCWRRMHAHIKTRKVCKWVQKSSLSCTFDLFHEIGHIETKKSWMHRVESEYFATTWAIDRFNEYGLKIPEKTLLVFQRYILYELARGKRRHGKGYQSAECYNLYKYCDIDKSIKQFCEELPSNWAAVINKWVEY